MSTLGSLPPAPFLQILDSNGAPVSGAKIYTYYTGTTTAAPVYTDAALSTPAANPVVCDSAGVATFYLAATVYKFLITTSAGVTIRTIDPVFGFARTTAPSQQCGRLTVTSGSPNPTPTAGLTSTTVYFTPYKGNTITPYYNGYWTPTTFPELSASTSSLTASKPFDAFVYLANGTTPTLELLSWSSDTARATNYTTQDGVEVKSGDATRLLVGSGYVNGSKQVSWTPTICGLQNRYNDEPYEMSTDESTVSWSYTTASWRQARGTATNQLEVVSCLGLQRLDLNVRARFTTAAVTGQVGIGEDSTSTPLTPAQGGSIGALQGTGDLPINAIAQRRPAVGRHTYVWLEYGGSGLTWYGSPNGSGIFADWRA